MGLVRRVNRRALVGGLAGLGLAGLSLLSGAGTTLPWQPRKPDVYRIGYLVAGSLISTAPNLEAFRGGLRDLG